MNTTLFDHDHNLSWPEQRLFPVNEPSQGLQVHPQLKRDIEDAQWFYVITGFTSLSNLIKFFGERDFSDIAFTRIVFGFELNERTAQNQPAYQLSKEVKNVWLRQNVSVLLAGPIINLIDKIKLGEIDVKYIPKLHAKIYVSDKSAMIGSSNFSGSGLTLKGLREANFRVQTNTSPVELEQYRSLKKLAENYWALGTPYADELITLLKKKLKDATWQEALARALAEVLESRWMEDYPELYQAIMSRELWPSQRLGIGRAMNIIKEQGNLLIADPTGSGKTRMATALAYTIFHWMYENGLKERSNAFIVAPPQVLPEWKSAEASFKLFNRVESIGRLSFGSDKDRAQLVKDMERASILIIDEAHNFLNPLSRRSKAVQPRSSTHVILATATPLNKKPEDLLRLIELLDIDNLSDEDLASYLQLRKEVRKRRNPEHIHRLSKYINQFILRRTKEDLNKIIDWEPSAYVNKRGKPCRYPESVPYTYPTGETADDRKHVAAITQLLSQLKGVHYLRRFEFPADRVSEKDKRDYLKQRFDSAPALAAFAVKSALRSSACALYEYLYGSENAMAYFKINAVKTKSGETIAKIQKMATKKPETGLDPALLRPSDQWILQDETYSKACKDEVEVYKQIGNLCMQLSDSRERRKARLLVKCVGQYKKVLAFDSTVLTLDYLKKLIEEEAPDLKVLVATGQSEQRKREVREKLGVDNMVSEEQVLALCSDAMAESINLPSAKALVLLDMPSVLRIIEQRIGRIERMDSEHKEIYVYWPDDSEEYALAGDRRMIEILVTTDALIGNNVNIPQQGIFEKYYKESLDAPGIIRAYERYRNEDSEWEGVKDTTQCLLNLIGEKGLITRAEYDFIKEVDAEVNTAISFVETSEAWSFFAIKGDTKRSAKWVLIDTDGTLLTDFSTIADKLTAYLKGKKIIQRKWKDVNGQKHLEKVVHKLRQHEKQLLPPKKRRALEKAEKLLDDFAKKAPGRNPEHMRFIQKLKDLFNPQSEEGRFLDYDYFAELWLRILLPALDAKKDAVLKKRTIYTLKNLTPTDVSLTLESLKELYENCRFTNSIDALIVACIIAVPRPAYVP